MPITLTNQCLISGSETLAMTTAGNAAATVSHTIGRQGTSTQTNVFSQAYTAVEDATATPTDLSLAALAYPQLTGTLDLATGQRLVLFAIQNNGTEPVTYTFGTAAAGATPITGFVRTIQAAGIDYIYTPGVAMTGATAATHLFLACATTGQTTDVTLLLGTETP